MKSSSDWLFFDGSERHALGATRWFGIPGDPGTIPSTGETLLASQTSVAPNELAEVSSFIYNFIGCHTCLRC